MMRWMFCGALALAAACGGDDDGGGGGTVTATGNLDGEAFDFSEACVTDEREDYYSVYATQGDDLYSLEILWNKTAIEGPGTQTLDAFAGIFIYATLGPEITDIETAEGIVTFDTFMPEDGVLSGSFEINVVDAAFAATGTFDCM